MNCRVAIPLASVVVRRIRGSEHADLPKVCSGFRRFAGGDHVSRRRKKNASQRVGLAAALLRTTTLTVREVGERVGLNDPFHFSRFFKKETSESPAVYRKGRGFF
jgi:hypothetical protein